MHKHTKKKDGVISAMKQVNVHSVPCTGEKTYEHGRSMANKSQNTKTKKDKRKSTIYYEFTGHFGRFGALSTIDIAADGYTEALTKLQNKVKYGFKGRDPEGCFQCEVIGYRIVKEIQPHKNIEPINLGKIKVYKK